MKRSTLIILLFALLGLILALPCVSDAAGGYRGGGHGFRGGYYHGYHGWHGYGWYGPRVFIGPGYVAPWYYPPPPVYVVPAPSAYAMPAPDPAYAYPDPAVTPGYPQGDQGNGLPSGPGEWVTVPGQYVDGRWIGEHQAWVPANP